MTEKIIFGFILQNSEPGRLTHFRNIQRLRKQLFQLRDVILHVFPMSFEKVVICSGLGVSFVLLGG